MEHKSRILVVDDEKIMRKMLGAALTKNDYLVDYAEDGYEAIRKVRQVNYDLILLDVTMPGMDGFETCKRMIDYDSELAIIQCTSNTDNQSLAKGFDVGALDYIRKPWQKVELLARVKNILRIKAAEKEKQRYYKTLQDDIKTASTIMTMILPEWLYLDQNVLFVSDYVPSNHVGGDLYNYIKINENQYVVYLGDISGHGVQAALLMSAVRATINMTIDEYKHDFDIVKIISEINYKLSKDLFRTNDSYFTLLFGLIDIKEKTFEYINCGHPPFLEYDFIEHKTIIHDGVGTIPIGWKAKMKFDYEDVNKIKISQNNMILLYTDGINESVDKDGNELGINGLSTILSKVIQHDCPVVSPFKIKQYLLDNNYKLSGDDFTLFSFQLQSEEKQAKNYHSKKIVYMMKAAMKNVGIVVSEAEKLVTEWTKNEMLGYKAELIIDELLNNIIEHGLKFDENSKIIFEFKIIDNKLVISMWDKGIEWNPSSNGIDHNNPYDFEKDLYEECGRGMNIVFSWSESYNRKRIANELNETKVTLDIDHV